MTYTIHFEPGNVTVDAPSGMTLGEAARRAGFDLNQPCGGQGRCGRCAVMVDNARSAVRRRSTIRLSPEDLDAGYALACQTVIEGECYVTIPPQEAIERRLTTQKAAARVQVPFDYDPERHQSVRRYFLRLDPPDYSDQTDDWSRVQRELARQGVKDARASLATLRQLGSVLRGDPSTALRSAQDDTAWEPWEVTAVVALDRWDAPQGPAEVLAVLPGDQVDRNFGAAIHSIDEVVVGKEIVKEFETLQER